MRYDITKPVAPAMPNLGKGTECFKLLLSQASKDMHEPLFPMAIPALSAHLSGVDLMYSDNKYYELCGQMGILMCSERMHEILKKAPKRLNAKDAECLNTHFL